MIRTFGRMLRRYALAVAAGVLVVVSELSVLAAGALEEGALPQAARLTAMHRAAAKATNFFIFFSLLTIHVLLVFLFPSCGERLKYTARFRKSAIAFR